MSKNAIAKSAPSRRAILAAGPAAAVLSTVGKAKAETYPVASDPIFAAIDAARRARAAHAKVSASIRDAARDRPELREGFIFVAKADGDSEKVSTINHLNVWLDHQGPARRVDCKRTFAEAAARVLGIKEPPVADPSAEALAAWEAERAAVVAEFESARRAYDEAQQKAGLPSLYDASSSASDVMEAAEAALLATVPTTPPGGVALMRFCLDAMDRYGDHVEVMPAMENALAAMESVLAI
jgi:hypothetical protein